MEPQQVTPVPQGTAPEATPVEPVAPVVPAESVAPATPAPASAPAPVTPPTETKDKTREQFEKLLDSNRRLFEANEYLRKQVEQRQESNKVFEPVQRTNQTPQVDPNDFVEVDQETGARFINESKLQARLQDLQTKANRAEQTVQSYIKTAEEREIERQNKEAFVAYPELNPGGKDFDLGFHKLVRGALYDSMNFADENGGKPFSFREAADFVRAQIPKAQMANPPTIPAPAPATPPSSAGPAENAQALKEQGSAQASSQPRGKVEISDEDELKDLQYRTRFLNDDNALARRILNTEHTVKKPEEEA